MLFTILAIHFAKIIQTFGLLCVVLAVLYSFLISLASGCLAQPVLSACFPHLNLTKANLITLYYVEQRYFVKTKV